MPNKRKVFDVIPPQEKKTAREDQVKKTFSKKIKVSFTKKPIEKKPEIEKPVKQIKAEKPAERIQIKEILSKKEIHLPKIPIPKMPIFVGLAIISIVALGFFLIKPKAEITIFPVKDVLEFKTEVLVDVSSNTTTTILGEVLIQNKTVSQEFTSTGKSLKSAKAQGFIRVYNAYSIANQSLLATTRFVSDDGKLFRTPKKVIIPGGHYEGSKLVPGEIDILVEAGEPGEEYNIGPSTFSIPGFAGTPRYTAFYAKSFEPMTGGMIGEVQYVSGDDLNNAETILTERALIDVQTALENTLALREYFLIEEAMTKEVTEINPLVEEYNETDMFVFQVKSEAKALTFKEQDMISFARNFILGRIPKNKRLKEDSLQISYSTKNIDLDNGKIDLALEMSAQIYSAIEEDSVMEAIKNQRQGEVKILLRKFPEIDKVHVRLWPFWSSTVPQTSERIEIILSLD